MNEYDALFDAPATSAPPPPAPAPPVSAPRNEYDDLLATPLPQDSVAPRYEMGPESDASMRQSALWLAMQEDQQVLADRARASGMLRSTFGEVVPPVLVDIQAATRRQEIARMDYLLRDSPVTSTWLVDRVTAGKDAYDLETLTSLEKVLRPLMAAPFDVLGYGPTKAAGGVVGVAGSVFDVAAQALQPVLGKLPKAELTNFAQWLSDYAEKYNPGIPENAGILEKGVRSGMRSLGMTGPALLGGAAMGGGPAVLEGVLGAMSAGQGGISYLDTLKQTDDAARAFLHGLTDASFEYLGEKLGGTGVLFDKQAWAKGLLGGIFKFTTREVPSEMATTIAQNFDDWVYRNPGKTAGEFLAEQPEALIETAIATLVGGGGQVALVKGVEAMLGNDVQVSKAETHGLALTDLFNAAAASTLLESDPQTFAEFFQQAAPDAVAYVSPEALDKALAAAGLPLDVLPSVTAETRAEAAAMGIGIEVPLSELVTNLAGTGAETALIPELRMGSPDALTLPEAKERGAKAWEFFQAEAERALSESVSSEQFKSEVAAIEGAVKTQLDALDKFGRQMNDGYAKLWGAFYATLAGKMGITPLQLRDGWTDANGVVHRGYKPAILGEPTAEMQPSETLDEAPRQPAAPEDFAPGKVQDIINRDNWTVLEAGNPGGQQATPEENAASLAALKAELDKRGLKYYDAKGSYFGTKADSVLVLGIPEADAIALGNQFGQESIVTRKGLVFGADNTVAVTTGVREVTDMETEDHTYIPELGVAFRLDIPDSAWENKPLAEDLAQVDLSLVPGFAKIEKGLTAAEKEKLNRGTVVRLIDRFNGLPPVDEFAAAAWAGRAKRGWYAESARAIAQVFGRDAPRFAALLASLSPQVSVETNLLNALNVWANWVKAGRPTHIRDIKNLLGQSVQGAGNFNSVLNAWVPNSIRALTDEDPAKTILSGPKVDSFMRNLLGDVEQVTNDSWVANFALVDQAIFRGSLTATDAGKGTGYLAMNAKRLSKLTGETWSPAEVQETIWSWAKTLYENQGEFTAQELVEYDAITDDLIRSTPDFKGLFHDAKYERILRDAGLGDQLDALYAAPAAQPGTAGQKAPFAPETQRELERRSAWRLERLKALRGAEGEELAQSGKPAGVNLTGVHYSQQPRTILEPGKYGTGMRGGEAKRLQYAADARLKQRTAFYLNTGNGIFPESGVGTKAHTAELTNLYDADTDALGLFKGRYGEAVNDAESAVLDAGYEGYFTRNFGKQGAAVVFKSTTVTPVDKADVPVVPAREQEMFQASPPKLGSFNPTTFDLRLLADANASTFLHETGHFFLTVYADLASQPGAPQEVVDDMNALLAWFGIEANPAGVPGGPELEQKVWHGTPHVWAPEPGFPHGRPRLDKIGTGEGAWVYGWGWYSAEARGVGENYLKVRAVTEPVYTVLGAVAAPDTPEHHAAALMADTGRTLAGVRKEVRGWIAGAAAGEDTAHYSAVLAVLEKAQSKKDFKVSKPKPSLYQLEIPDDVSPYLLDWDSETQAAEVMRALQPWAARKQAEILADLKARDRNFPGSIKAGAIAEVEGQTSEEFLAANFEETGEDLYGQLVDEFGSEERASKYLATLGIVGLRYLDQNSRTAGEGTRNYVIWDQPTLDRVALLERNGEVLEAMREADTLAQTDSDRMARAKAQGFDVDDVLYHWSPTPDFTQFKPFQHFGTAEAADTRYQWPASGNKTFAELEARKAKGSNGLPAEGAVFPVVIKKSKVLKLGADTGQHDAFNLAFSIGKKLRDKTLADRVITRAVRAMTDDQVRAWAKVEDMGYLFEEGEDMSVDSMRRLIEMQYLDYQGSRRTTDGSMVYVQTLTANTDQDAALRDLANYLETKGVTALSYTNDVEDPGSVSYIIPDPRNVRSVHAEFKAAGQYDMLDQTGDLFPQEFATRRSTVTDTRVISTKGTTEKVRRGNLNSENQEITQTMQGLRNFWDWFAESAAVTKNRPTVMYHSTTGDFSEFEALRPTVNTGLFGVPFETRRAGIFVTPERGFAQTYRTGETGSNVMPVYIAAQNPVDLRNGLSNVVANDLERQGFNTAVFRQVQYDWELFDEEFGGVELVDALYAAGYDSAIINEADEDGIAHETWVVFDSQQIKSAVGNVGTFDLNNPNILRQGRPVANLPSALPPGRTPLEVWNAMTLDQQRPYHEQFAESFEQYLFDGKAPTTELQPLFRRFADWLSKVYYTIKDFIRSHPGAKLNPEVQAIMGRMVASNEALAAEQAKRAYVQLFKDATEAGMALEEFAAYQALPPAARTEAEEFMRSRMMRDIKYIRDIRTKTIEALQKDARGKRAELLAEVRAEVVAQPIYQAIRFLKHGETLSPNGDTIKVPGAAAKLNIEALKQMFPEEALGEQPDWRKLGYGVYGMLSKDGLHPDQVAEMYGFASGAQLVNELLTAPSQKAEVENLTDQRMLERYSDLATPDAIARTADEAIHNDVRVRLLATELNALNAEIGSVAQIAKAAKAYAAALMDGKGVRAIKPWQFAAAEVRAGKEAIAALKKGDRAAAALAKRSEILNHVATRAAYDAVHETEKIVARLRKIAAYKDDSSSAKSRDMDVVNAVRAVLTDFGFGTVKAGQRATEYMKLVRQHDPALADVLDAEVADLTANAKEWDKLKLSELRSLAEGVEVMWHLAKRAKMAEVDGKMVPRKEIEQALWDRLAAIGIPDRIPGEGHAVTPGEEFRMVMSTMVAALRRVEQWTEAKDGKHAGPFNQYIWAQIKDAADTYRSEKAVYLQRYRALLDNVASTLRREKIDAPEIGYVFGEGTGGLGKAELLHALLHTGNASNKRKLLLGRGWATDNNGVLDTRKWDAFLARMQTEGKLTKTDYDFVQGVWDLLEDMKPAAQKAHRSVFGRYFDEVTADAFTTPFGTYLGGYVPAIADPQITGDAQLRALAEQENESLAYAYPTTPRGFTKARVEYNRPLKLDLRSLAQHIDKVLLFSHLTEPVTDVRRVLMSKQVSQALNRVDPAAMGTILTPFLNRTAKQIVETSSPEFGKLSRFWSTLRARAGMAAMFANVANAAQQVTGVALAAVKVRPKYLMEAQGHALAHRTEMLAFMISQSKYMAERMNNDVIIADQAINNILLKPSVYESAENWTRKHAYFMQAAVDNHFSPVIWAAAFNQAKEENLTDLQARRFADATVRETQGSQLPEEVAAFEVGSPFYRMFVQFTGYFNMVANLLGNEVVYITRDMGLRAGAGRALYVFLMGFMAQAMVGELIMQLFRGGPDDEDKDGEYLDDWLMTVLVYGPARYATAMVPFAGQAANALINTWNHKPYDDRMSTSPAVSMIEAAVRAPNSLYKALAEEGKPSRAAVDVSTAMSMVTGLPVRAVAKPVGYLLDVEAERVEPTSSLDLARGIVSGTASPESKQ